MQTSDSLIIISKIRFNSKVVLPLVLRDFHACSVDNVFMISVFASQSVLIIYACLRDYFNILSMFTKSID